jgi:hypothetical protein
MRQVSLLPNKIGYRTTNVSKYNSSLKMCGSLTVWIDKDLQWLAKASDKRGGQKALSVSLPYSSSDGKGLHLLLDSTGIKCLCEGE